MTLNKKITLLKLRTQNGAGGFAVEKSLEVWANVSDIGVTTKFSAAAASKRAELQIICRRCEADGFTHVDYNGTRYKIESTGSIGNDRFIKLIIAKDG